jgi:transcriptional regulator with XRE-family HTH domain
MTQRALAHRVQISTSTISSYEKGTRKPDIEIFYQIATVLETPYAFFFGDDAMDNALSLVKDGALRPPRCNPEYIRSAYEFESLFRELADDREGKWNWVEFNYEFCTAVCRKDRIKAIWKLFRKYLLDDSLAVYRQLGEE